MHRAHHQPVTDDLQGPDVRSPVQTNVRNSPCTDIIAVQSRLGPDPDRVSLLVQGEHFNVSQEYRRGERPFETIVGNQSLDRPEQDSIIQTDEIVDLGVVILSVAGPAKDGRISVVAIKVLVRSEPDLLLRVLGDGADGERPGPADDLGHTVGKAGGVDRGGTEQKETAEKRRECFDGLHGPIRLCRKST